MNRMIMTEMELPTKINKRLVIFGATGDLCRRKLVPALFELWTKQLLPENLLIVGASRREMCPDEWKKSLGDYPEEFTLWLDLFLAIWHVKKV